jgi:threonine aldolase
MSMNPVDFRSDTVTRPTAAMRRAMAEAEVGDDVYGEDPTVNRLESLAAERLGLPAAVFMPSGTMANQAAVMAHTRPGDELMASSLSHVIRYEAGGAARLSGVSLALTDKPVLDQEEVRRLARPVGDVHFPVSRLIWQENALSNGQVVDLAGMTAVRAVARELGLKVHLDGARLFNAAWALGVEARELAAQADSVAFCLSKGLAAPVGSILVGTADFIQEARRCRKVLGGGLRQAGILAAAGLVALDEMVKRLPEDHAHARLLANLMAEMPGVEIEPVKINMVFWRAPGLDHEALIAYMAGQGFRLSPPTAGVWRLVTHYEIGRADILAFAARLREFLACPGSFIPRTFSSCPVRP